MKAQRQRTISASKIYIKHPFKRPKPKKRKRRTSVSATAKLQKHPILLTARSFKEDDTSACIRTLPHSLSISQLEVNHHLKLLRTPSISPRKKPRRRPLSASSNLCNNLAIISEKNKIKLKKLRHKKQRKRPMSARTSLDGESSSRNRSHSFSVQNLLTESQNNELRKPVTLITTKTPQGSFMIQTPRPFVSDDIEPSNDCNSKSMPSSPLKKKKRKRAKSHHIVLKHKKKENLSNCTDKSKQIEHVYYMEKRPIKFQFYDDANNGKNGLINMQNRRDLMWQLMIKNGKRMANASSNSQSPLSSKYESPSKEEKFKKRLAVIPNIGYNQAKRKRVSSEESTSTSQFMTDMFVRHHSPKFNANPKLKKSVSLTTDELDIELISPSKRQNYKKKVIDLKVPCQSLAKSQRQKPAFGMKTAAFIMLIRAKLRLKQKKALKEIKKSVICKYKNNMPRIKSPDEFLRPFQTKHENQTKISECLKVFGRKRMRILTFIFKHIDFERIGEISFDAVMQFDLMLIPEATKAMLHEDADLFFKFSGLTERPRMNMLEWMFTWKMAVQKTGSFAVIDHFFNQYFETFREAKFRLSVVGVIWP